MPRRGHNPGQPVEGAALDWASYLDALIAEHGTLAAVAERLAAAGRTATTSRASPARCAGCAPAAPAPAAPGACGW
jgi:hypothetical protein